MIKPLCAFVLVAILVMGTYFLVTNFLAEKPSSAVIESSRVCSYGFTPTYTDSQVLLGCEEILVPENASLNVAGTDWECNKGFVMQYAHGYTRYCYPVR